MIVGITGTRYGLTKKQRESFMEFFSSLGIVTEFHHGHCQGVDEETSILVANEWPGVLIYSHPGPENDPWRSTKAISHRSYPPTSHFARNRQIVDLCGLLIVCPKDMERQERGGTWYTFDYAKKKGKNIVVIWPDGSLLLANGKAS